MWITSCLKFRLGLWKQISCCITVLIVIGWLYVYMRLQVEVANWQLQDVHQPTNEVKATKFKLNVAISKNLTAEQLVKQISLKIPSIPFSYQRAVLGYRPLECSLYPSFYSLEFNNEVWQHFRADDGADFYIFGAYYDDRELLPFPVVRLLVMVNKIRPPNLTCQLWYGKIKPKIVKAMRYKYMWREKWGNYEDGILQPFLISCPWKKKKGGKWKSLPESVSLVSSRCQNATNNVRVFNNRLEIKEGFAVCVKGLSFWDDDISPRLVEWIELIKLLGAHKIFFYVLSVHPNITKVLDYYTDGGYVETTWITLPGMQLNDKNLLSFYLDYEKTTKRQNELIPYNDCFYKNIHRYKYVVLLDIDEIIVPLRDETWPQLMKRLIAHAFVLKNKIRASFYASNVYFFDDVVHSQKTDVPDYMYMLQHNLRAINRTQEGSFVKSFFNTRNVVVVHNHHPLACIKPKCSKYSIPMELAQLQHYRKECEISLRKKCGEIYKRNNQADDSLLKFKTPLIENTERVLKRLGFLTPVHVAELP